MQKQCNAAKPLGKWASEQIVLYKAISIVSERLSRKLAALEKRPIYVKGGYGYDPGQSTVTGE